MMRAWLLTSIVGLLLGCASQSEPGPPAPLPLPPPAALGAPIMAEQRVVAAFGDRVYVCRSIVRLSEARAEFVCIDDLGQRLLAIDWDAGGVRAGTLPPGVDLPPEFVAGEIAAMLAAPGSLAESYSAAGLSVIETPTERRVLAGRQTILSVVYEPDLAGRWTGRSRLTNLRTGHSIEVRSRLLTP